MGETYHVRRGFYKKVFAITGLLLLLLAGGSQVLAQDYGKLLEAIAKEKAVDSVDAEKLKGAYKEGGGDLLCGGQGQASLVAEIAAK